MTGSARIKASRRDGVVEAAGCGGEVVGFRHRARIVGIVREGEHARPAVALVGVGTEARTGRELDDGVCQAIIPVVEP